MILLKDIYLKRKTNLFSILQFKIFRKSIHFTKFHVKLQKLNSDNNNSRRIQKKKGCTSENNINLSWWSSDTVSKTLFIMHNRRNFGVKIKWKRKNYFWGSKEENQARDRWKILAWKSTMWGCVEQTKKILVAKGLACRKVYIFHSVKEANVSSSLNFSFFSSFRLCVCVSSAHFSETVQVSMEIKPHIQTIIHPSPRTYMYGYEWFFFPLFFSSIQLYYIHRDDS